MYLENQYSEPSLQRQHLFPKTMSLKWICCWTEYLMSRLIYMYKQRFCFVLISSENICFGYLLESPHRGDSNKYPKHMFLLNINTIFLHNLWLIVTSLAKVSWHSNCHYNEFCRCIECGYKEGCLYYLELCFFERVSFVIDVTRISFTYTMVRAHIRCDNARAWASILSYAHAQNHGIHVTHLSHFYACWPTTSEILKLNIRLLLCDNMQINPVISNPVSSKYCLSQTKSRAKLI